MSELVDILKNGGVAVIPTDTIYGIVGQALKEITVNRIYQIKGRKPDKPFIILLSTIDQLNDFGVKTSANLDEYWPGPNSLIFKTSKTEEFKYLTRGGETLAFRLPNQPEIRALIDKTGPLVAPSANPEGLEPAKNVKQAKEYFGNKVEYYLGGGQVVAKPSSLYDLSEDQAIKLR